MKSYHHAKSSAKRHGGEPGDYLPVHDFIDSSKSSYADVQHRAMLHSTWGIFLVEKVFGPVIVNSKGKEVPTRQVAEEHVFEDMGFIPTMEDWLKHMDDAPWMRGRSKQNRRIGKTMRFDEVFGGNNETSEEHG